MEDALTTIIAIFIAALLMFIFPVSTIADFNDDTSQMYVKTTLDTFINNIIGKGKITKIDYEQLEAQLEATNNSYDINIVVSIADVNPGKKEGEKAQTIYYSEYTEQIKNTLYYGTGVYYLKEGDYIKVSVVNNNKTISQMLKNIMFGLTGNENYVVSASASGIVVVTGY